MDAKIYSQDDLDRKKADVQNTTEFRVRLEMNVENIRDTVDSLQEMIILMKTECDQRKEGCMLKIAEKYDPKIRKLVYLSCACIAVVAFNIDVKSIVEWAVKKYIGG